MHRAVCKRQQFKGIPCLRPKVSAYSRIAAFPNAIHFSLPVLPTNDDAQQDIFFHHRITSSFTHHFHQERPVGLAHQGSHVCYH
jgi:hypothetical protein